MNTLRKRPLGITLLALPFLWIGGLGTLIFPLVMVVAGGPIWDNISLGGVHSSHWAFALVVTGLTVWWGGYILYAFIGFGLWTLRGWALKTVTIVIWFVIVSALIAEAFLMKDQPLLLLPMGIAFLVPLGAILWYLKRPTVQYAFAAATPSLASEMPMVIPAPSTVSSLQLPVRRSKLWIKVTVVATIVLVSAGLFVWGLFFEIEKSFRASDVYKLALQDVGKSPCAVAKFGSPIISSGIIKGNLTVGSDDGSADLDIPVSGPLGKGTMHLESNRANKQWHTKDLTLMHKDGQIHLLPVPSACP